jgi:pyruvate/2-oxoacid:ferredoxin oxidoreductase alpha subunit
MHELLFWTSYARLPIVMVNVNRAMAPGWNIWADQTDSLAQRDTGWIQIYCEDNQEVLDSVLMAWRLAEQVRLPVMVIYDAFILSHTYEPVEIPEQKLVDRFLPPLSAPPALNTIDPRAVSPLTSPDSYMEFRHLMESAHTEALKVSAATEEEFAHRFHRRHPAIEAIDAEDADVLLVTSGAMTSTARVAVRELRAAGEKVGILKLRLFRPFPVEALRETIAATSGARIGRKLAVLDRNISHGAGGIWAQEIKAALSGVPRAPQIFSFHLGLGGRDVTPDAIAECYRYTKEHDQPGKPVWIGLKR